MTPTETEFARENTVRARTLMNGLAAGGLRTVVLAPGSRSTPLVYAAARHPDIRILVQPDERSAAFLALGVGKSTGRPAGVITTSGTAVANLLPAVVESERSESPLLLLTADRPPRLRGADANQTIEQQGIFGRCLRLEVEVSPTPDPADTVDSVLEIAHRAMAAAVGTPAGPVHLNLPFEKPLEPVAIEAPPIASASGPGVQASHPLPTEAFLDELVATLASAERPLLVAGRLPRPWESGPALGALARRVGAPLFADPLSGARFLGPGSGVMGGYDVALGSARVRDALVPDLIVRFGASPTSGRLLAHLASLAGTPHMVIDGGIRPKDHQEIATAMIRGEPARVAHALVRRLGSASGGGAPPPSSWLAHWRRVEARVEQSLPGLLDTHPCEGTLVHEVVRTLPPEEILFISSSMPVRDLDAFGLPGLRGSDHGGPLLVLGNRGASGIDGILSTAIGAGVGRGRPVTAIVGDLALLHDMNGLLALAASGVRLTLVVVNNDGGGIFHLLPVRDHEPEFTPFVATPHGREPAKVAALHDLPFHRLDARLPTHSREAVTETLRAARRAGGSVLVEIRTDREVNRKARETVLRAIAERLEADAGPGADPAMDADPGSEPDPTPETDPGLDAKR